MTGVVGTHAYVWFGMASLVFLLADCVAEFLQTIACVCSEQAQDPGRDSSIVATGSGGGQLEVYENDGIGRSQWTDETGTRVYDVPDLAEIQAPKGWAWSEDNWVLDVAYTAQDEAGWSYGE